MKKIWEEEMKLQCMLEVEIAVCEQLTSEGKIPKEGKNLCFHAFECE